MFEITYITSNSDLVTEDLLPHTTLATRVRVIKPHGQIHLLDKISLGLILFANFVWEKEISYPDFFSYETASEPTVLEQKRTLLAIKLGQIFTNKTYTQKLAETILSIAATKKDMGVFVIPLDSDDPHDSSTISDEAIADLIQKVVVNDLEAVMRLI